MRLLVAALLALPVFQFAQETPEQAGEKAAQQWLALVDAQKYGESWEQAAEVFKSAVARDSWREQVSTVRHKIGKLKSRMLKSARYSENPPNAPPGKYVIIQYESSFAIGPTIETVVPMQEKDGTWKVSGYFVKPAGRNSE